MYIQLLLDDLSDLLHTKPQYCSIPALIFSSDWSSISCAYRLLVQWHDQLDIDISFVSHLNHLLVRPEIPNIHLRSFEALRRLPHCQRSWSTELAITMKLVLQELVHLSWPGPTELFYTGASPHRRWLRQRKGLKQISLGSPKLSSAISHYLVNVAVDEDSKFEEFPRFPFPHPIDGFLLSCWRRVLSYEPRLDGKIWSQKWRCGILLKVVINYLHKSDCISEVVKLARKSLPMVAQWHPKAMKKARAQMDAYAQRWEGVSSSLIFKLSSDS